MEKWFASFLTLTLILNDAASLPITFGKSNTRQYSDEAVEYLIKYGYLQNEKKPTKREIMKAISIFQWKMGIKPSGLLTDSTRSVMQDPRCGEPDISTGLRNQNAFIAVHASFSYSIQSWSNKFNKKVQNDSIWRSVWDWSKQFNLDVTWSSNISDINIYFAKEQSNENRLTSNRVAITMSTLSTKPNQIYNIYVNENTTSTVKDLKRIFQHSFGHVLGYSHGWHPYMNPIVGTVDCRIQSVYSDLSNGNSYFFKNVENDTKFWRLSSGHRMDDGYPLTVSANWTTLPKQFDEIFVWGYNWNTYIFKGNMYYRYRNGRVDQGYPVEIRRGWRGIPNNIDAAFTDTLINTYFFKKDKVYLYDNSLNEVAAGYPKLITDVFPGIPDNLDSAFRYYRDGEHYFFKGSEFYIWKLKMNQAIGPYHITKLWSNLCI